jgi:hypothetical protein
LTSDVSSKETGEKFEALGEILIRKVDTRVRYAGSVGPDRVGDMANTDCVQMFPVRVRASLLHETLRVQVVVVLGYEDVDVSHQLKYVQTLFQRLTRQLDFGTS